MAIETKRFILALSFAAFCLAAIPLILWGLSLSIAEHCEAISSGRQLIIISTSHGYLPGVLLGLGVLAALAVTTLVFDFGNRKNANAVAKSQKLAIYGMVTALALTFAGNFVVAAYWEAEAERASYKKCPPMTLLMNHLTYTAWVKNLDLCHDRDVRHIVLDGSPAESTQVEARLNAKKRIEKAREK